MFLQTNYLWGDRNSLLWGQLAFEGKGRRSGMRCLHASFNADMTAPKLCASFSNRQSGAYAFKTCVSIRSLGAERAKYMIKYRTIS